jgi:putative ABC transport system substrate-binding protein
MNRRRFLLAAVAGALTAPIAAEAQQAGKVWRIGYVVPPAGPNPVVDAFVGGLRELGYVEGRNVTIERRYMAGRESKYAEVLNELQQAVDVIVAAGPPAALAAKKVVTKVPVVFSAVGDPVAIGLVTNLARPGGNVTGVAFDVSPEIAGKRLELLKAATPTLSSVAALRSSDDPVGLLALRHLDGAGSRLGIQLRAYNVRGVGDFDKAFSAITTDRANGILVVGGPAYVTCRKRLIDFTSEHRLPAISFYRQICDDGGLMAYGPSLSDQNRRAATYVDKILKGARPADLPVEQPAKFELVINLKTAKALGLTIPPSLLARADQVIE